MRSPLRKISKKDFMICPMCEAGELGPRRTFIQSCDSCGYVMESEDLATLQQIVALPDAVGCHACECGHPEMRLLPDGVFRCPACGSEVVPHEPAC